MADFTIDLFCHPALQPDTKNFLSQVSGKRNSIKMALIPDIWLLFKRCNKLQLNSFTCSCSSVLKEIIQV